MRSAKTMITLIITAFRTLEMGWHCNYNTKNNESSDIDKSNDNSESFERNDNSYENESNEFNEHVESTPKESTRNLAA